MAERQTEFPFTLPHGITSPDGAVHRTGVMRLPTARDELEPLEDPRVRANPGYALVIRLSRVITHIGDVDHVDTVTIENMPAADLNFLNDLYQRVAGTGSSRIAVTCPHCSEQFEMETAGSADGARRPARREISDP